MDHYMRMSGNDPLRALVNACGDGDLGAVMAISSHVWDINSQLSGMCLDAIGCD